MKCIKYFLIFNFLYQQNICATFLKKTKKPNFSLVNKRKFQQNVNFIKTLNLWPLFSLYATSFMTHNSTMQDIEEHVQTFLKEQILTIKTLNDQEYFTEINSQNGQEVPLLHLKTIFYLPKDQVVDLFVKQSIVIDLRGRAIRLRTDE